MLQSFYMKLTFPHGFYWGAATASHQVEGNTFNQWSEWELSPARRAQLESSGLVAQFGLDNYISGIGPDHYHRFNEDFALAHDLGHNATRFSIEWSRIEPEEGVFNAAAIEHYQSVIASTRANKLEPFVTLWHWTVPVWFEAQGGWTNPRATEYFTRFVETIVTALPDVTFWITLNEPDIYVMNSYYTGEWPPQKTSAFLSFHVIQTLIATHKRAYACIKKINSKAQVGIAKHNVYFEPARKTFINRLLANSADSLWNHYFLRRINTHQDFIGINNYFHHRIDNGFNKNLNHHVSDMGWELYPESLYHVVRAVRHYNKPIYITEHGLADKEDTKRAWFITESLKHLHRAISDGVDVRGYLHWSLMDNFEWAKGYWPCFGLIEIDRETKKRTPRPSALVYKKICQSNTLTLPK